MSENDEHKGIHESATTTVDADHLEPILQTPEPAHIPILRQLGVAICLLVLVFTTTYVGTILALVSPQGEDDVRVTSRLETKDASVFTDPFENVELAAHSALVWDVKTQKVLFSKDADVVLPLASITKLMTALVAYELMDDETTVNISMKAVRTDGDSGLKEGEKFTLSDLTDMVLMASSNDGAAALGAAAGAEISNTDSPERVFVEAMNLRAAELGLTNTSFKNTTGLDLSATEAGAYSTARDVASLLEYIITKYPRVTSLTVSQNARLYNEAGEYHDIENTNPIADSIDGLLASKTGYTELAGGNLAIAFDAGLNHPVIVVVLGSTFDNRFTDVLALTERARKSILHTTE
jgi:D-alanyl-D-alanine carboxypeptidase